MKFEALLLDLDGTILRPDQVISDNVIKAISSIRKRIPVCILTGRELAEVLDCSKNSSYSSWLTPKFL